MWGIDAGLQKTISKGKGNLKASVSDIFKTMQWGGTSDFTGQYIKAGGGWESRLFKLNLTGLKTLAQAMHFSARL
jgi:iron complex outermembrane receptor protein